MYVSLITYLCEFVRRTGDCVTEQFHVSSSVQPLLLGSAFLGMFLGALGINTLSDRIGRKKAFFLNLLVYSVFTFFGAFSPNIAFLIVCRFLAGVGIGSQPALCDVYLTEILPAKNRGRIIGWAYTIQVCAVPLEGFLARWIVPTHLGMAGWRWLFIIGALGALAAWVMQKNLPESPRWLEAVGRRTEAEKVFKYFAEKAGTLATVIREDDGWTVNPEKLPISTLFRKELVGRTLMLWTFHILQTIGYYGFGSNRPGGQGIYDGSLPGIRCDFLHWISHWFIALAPDYRTRSEKVDDCRFGFLYGTVRDSFRYVRFLYNHYAIWLPLHIE
jgi:putative MFS transporter